MSQVEGCEKKTPNEDKRLIYRECSSNHETMALAGFHWPISGLRLARNRRAILHNWYFVYTGSQGFRPYQGCGSTSRAPRPSSLSRAESGRRRLDRNGIGYI
ncbi:hypothetical protein PV325_009679 [Microctonus aethiopoides]|nr:hypothetical protein PV325_009679 [Microctonus aethiopoides]